MEFFDTHAHLSDEDLAADLDALLARAAEAGVSRMVTVGTTLASSRACLALAAGRPGLLAAVGIHPNSCGEAGADDWNQIEQLARSGEAAALGETGLDLYWDRVPLALQQDYFDRHLRLSQEIDLPFIVHMRQCEAEIMTMLAAAHRRGPLRGVMHSFTGDADMAAQCVAWGLHISFAGMVTFKKSQVLRDTAATIADDRILIETDSPYLSPEPLRGKRPNEPARVVHTAECLAEARGQSLEAFARQTTANAIGLFGGA